mgnify:CR=1 FL=1
MKILGMILLGVGGTFGIALVGGTVVGMIGVILYKIYRKLIEYMRNRQEHNGYIEIATPRIMDRVLWEISGHWDKYGAHNYSGKTEDEKQFCVK